MILKITFSEWKSRPQCREFWENYVKFLENEAENVGENDFDWFVVVGRFFLGYSLTKIPTQGNH